MSLPPTYGQVQVWQERQPELAQVIVGAAPAAAFRVSWLSRPRRVSLVKLNFLRLFRFFFSTNPPSPIECNRFHLSSGKGAGCGPK